MKIMSILQTETQCGSECSGWMLGTTRMQVKNPELWAELLCLGGREKDMEKFSLHCSLRDMVGPPYDAAALT